jgi:hypothetical protein
MPNLPISSLPASNALTGAEIFPLVQDGITKQTTFATITSGSYEANSYYLSAYHTNSIYLTGSAYSIYSMSFNTTDLSNGISISGSDNSKIKFYNNGVYNIQFSAQIDKTNSSNHKLYIWLAKNGTNVAYSNTAVAIFGGSNEESVAAWNFYTQASVGDYYQLLMATTDSNVLIQADPSPSGSIPAIPSIILTVGRVG